MGFVLIIDDNPNTADALREMITALGVEARTAYGSRAGLEVLSRQKPALILLDMNMPGLDGIGVLQYIRRDLQLQDIPVVIVTSDDQMDTYRRALENGANQLLVKPLMLDALETLLKEFRLL